MRKIIIAVTSLALLAVTTISSRAMDIPDLTGWGIQSNVSSTPTIKTGGSEFFPIENKLISTDSTDFTGLIVSNQDGQTFDLTSDNGIAVIKGDLNHLDTYYATWSTMTQPMQISFILRGPLKVGHVNFLGGSAALDSGDKKVLNAIANEIAKSHLYGVYLVGHSDRVGTYASNLAISEKRVLAAQSYLKSRLTALGVSGIRYSTEFMGDLMSKSKVNQANLADRRVDITIYP